MWRESHPDSGFLPYVSYSCCRCSRCARDDEQHRFSTAEEKRSANNLSSRSEGLIKHNLTVNTRGLLCSEDRVRGLCMCSHCCSSTIWLRRELKMYCNTDTMCLDLWNLHFMWCYITHLMMVLNCISISIGPTLQECVCCYSKKSHYSFGIFLQ